MALEKFEGWAMLSSACESVEGVPDSFAFHVEGSCACEAREKARELCRDELGKRGLRAEIVSTNKHEVAAVAEDGTELVYLVDVD